MITMMCYDVQLIKPSKDKSIRHEQNAQREEWTLPWRSNCLFDSSHLKFVAYSVNRVKVFSRLAHRT